MRRLALGLKCGTPGLDLLIESPLTILTAAKKIWFYIEENRGFTYGYNAKCSREKF